MAKDKPDPIREFTSGERRVALTRVYLKMTCPDLDQHGRTELAIQFSRFWMVKTADRSRGSRTRR